MRGQKLSQEDIDRILRSYVVTQDFTRTSKELGIPISTVRKKINENKDTEAYAKLCALKSRLFDERFISYANEVIEKSYARLIAMLDDDEAKISAKDLATILAINVDKKSVMKGNGEGDKRVGGVVMMPEVKADE